MLEVLAIAILGAATLAEQEQATAPPVDPRVLLGLDFVVRFTFGDHGDLMSHIAEHGYSFKIGDDHTDTIEKLLMEGAERAGWLDPDKEIILPNGSYVDDARQVRIQVERIQVDPTGLTGDWYTYPVKMTIPVEATSGHE